MSLHHCNIHCHTMTPDKLEFLNIEDDPGKWMPFLFSLDIVVAAKQTSEDPEEMTYNATTVFTDAGDTYIIDTGYIEFFRIWKQHTNTSSNDINIDDVDL